MNDTANLAEHDGVEERQLPTGIRGTWPRRLAFAHPYYWRRAGRLLRTNRAARLQLRLLSFLLRKHVLRTFRNHEVLRVPVGDLEFVLDAGSQEDYVLTEVFVDRVYEGPDGWRPTGADYVLDVGANIGAFTLWAAQGLTAGGVLESFEPHPDTFQRLKASVAANLVRPQIRLHNLALSSAEGEATLVPSDEEMNSTGFRTIRGSARGIAVKTEVLDAVAEQRPVALLKIDVEGHELEVLSGAPSTLSRTERVAIECHSPELMEAVVVMLRAAGLSLVLRRVGTDTFSTLFFRRGHDVFEGTGPQS